MRFERITINPEQMGGAPCIRGLRIPVAAVVTMVAEGMTREEILAAYPDLESDDIAESLRYAAEAVSERDLPLDTPDELDEEDRARLHAALERSQAEIDRGEGIPATEVIADLRSKRR